MNNRIVPKPSIVPDLDRHINGELKVGDYFKIREWLGAKAFVKVAVSAPIFGPSVTYCEEGTDGATKNQSFVHDVFRVQGIQYPSIVAIRYSAREDPHHIQLDVREFELEAANPDYVEATKASATSDECKCSRCSAKRRAAGRRWYKPWTWRR